MDDYLPACDCDDLAEANLRLRKTLAGLSDDNLRLRQQVTRLEDKITAQHTEILRLKENEGLRAWRATKLERMKE